MMSMVKFLGKEYSLPNDLEYYNEMFVFFGNMRDSLFESFIKMVEAQSDIPAIDCEEMLPEFEKHINIVIKMLCDKGVYSKTVDDYIKNKCYILFEKLTSNAVSQFGKMVKGARYTWEVGRASAEDNAISGVYGSGMRLFKKNILSATVYSAIEFCNIKSQASTAQKKYISESKNLGSSVMRQLNQDLREYANSQYIPDVQIVLTAYSYEIMDEFIGELIKAGKFDESTLRYIDLKKSNGILANLSLSDNKNAIFENAFLACPFNDLVYEKAAEHGLYDFETHQTASKFCPNNSACIKIIKNCTITDKNIDYKVEYFRIKPFLPIICSFLNISETQAVSALYIEQLDYYKDTISYYNSIIELTNKRVAKTFILELFNDEDVYSKTQEQIIEVVEQVINNNILPDNLMFLVSLGYSFSNFENNLDSQSLIGYFVKHIYSAVSTYIAESKKEREKIATLQNEFSNELQKMETSISVLEMELSSLGVFAIRKKNDIKKRIDAAKSKRDCFQNQSMLKEQLADYNANYI